MKKNRMLKKGSAIVITAALAFATLSGAAYAAGPGGTNGAYDSNKTDYLSTEDHTGNNTAKRQDNARTTTWLQNRNESRIIGANSGVVTLGKILNVNQKNKFPDIDNFIYKVTPISAWDNANVDTAKSGSEISRRNMPVPDSNSTDNSHKTALKHGGTDNWYSLVSIGNFSREEDNSSTAANSDAASNTDGIGEKYRRTRTTDLKFTFSKAGYYMYKVEEVGSVRNGTDIGGTEITLKDVAGVDYDNNTYYMVFYVTNEQQKTDTSDVDEYGHGDKTGDTAGQESNGGIYVNTITSWTNSQAAPEQHKPSDTQDSQALDNAKDLMKARDNNGEAAGSNTGKVDGNNDGIADREPVSESNGSNGAADPGADNKGPSTVSHDLGKVGVSTSDEPNKLEAYRMWNAQTTHDIVLKKNVTGNLGDRTKEFEFTVALTGLEKDAVYTTDTGAGADDISAGTENMTNTGDITTTGVKLYGASAGTVGTNEANAFTAAGTGEGTAFRSSSEGTATFKVKLKDDEVLVINALPRSASYQIQEAPSDHVAQYDIVSTNKLAEDEKAVITKAHDTNGRTSNKMLETGLEFVDRYDGTVTVIYQNNRDLAAITGVPGLDYIVYLMLAVIAAMTITAIIRRKRAYVC